MFCKFCGTPNNDDSKFCLACGKPLEKESDSKDGEETTTASAETKTETKVITKVVTKEIESELDLPEKFQPIGPWGYFWREILYSIPLLGFIFLVFHCFNDNINKRNFARSYFCAWILVLIFVLVFGLLMFFIYGTTLATMWQNLIDSFKNSSAS